MEISLSKFDLTVDTRRERVKVQDNPARNYMFKVNKKKHQSKVLNIFKVNNK